MSLIDYGIVTISIIGITFVLGEVIGVEQRPMDVTVIQKAFDIGNTLFISSRDEYVLLVLDKNGDEDLLDTNRETYLSVKADGNYTLLCSYGGVTGERGDCVL